VIYIGNDEYHKIQVKILKNIFHKDYHSQIIVDTLMSSPLDPLIYMLCPILLYFFKGSEVIACMLPITLLEINRINNFILLYRLINSNEENYEKITPNNEDDIQDKTNKPERVPNPIMSVIKKKEDLQQTRSIDNNQGDNKFIDPKKGLLNNYIYKFIGNINQEKSDFYKNEIRNRNRNLNSDNLSLSMFNAAFVIIALDLTYYFIYAFPMCLGISIHFGKNAFLHLLMNLIIAYQCDNGGFFTGNKFGKNQFGGPVTPSETKEGVYGAIAFGYIIFLLYDRFFSAYIYRFIIVTIFSVDFMNHYIFFFYTILTIFFALVGDFFESFLKRCGDVKDSGNIFPGYGGMLDRVIFFNKLDRFSIIISCCNVLF
jgi:hypothetical protein